MPSETAGRCIRLPLVAPGVHNRSALTTDDRTGHEFQRLHLVQPRRRREAGPGGSAWTAPAREAVAPPPGIVDLPRPDRPVGDARTVVVDPEGAGRLGVVR